MEPKALKTTPKRTVEEFLCCNHSLSSQQRRFTVFLLLFADPLAQLVDQLFFLPCTDFDSSALITQYLNFSRCHIYVPYYHSLRFYLMFLH